MTKQAMQKALDALERGEVLCEVTAANILRAALDAPVEPVAWVLFRKDEDGLEPIQFYGGKEKPEGEFKDRFELRPVCFADDTEAMRRDAERYRWLANVHGWRLLKHFPANRPYMDASEVIDEAIDAAIAVQGGKG